MFSKTIRRTVLLIDTMIFLALSVLVFGSDMVKDMNFYAKMIDHPELAEGMLDWLIFAAVVFVVPLVLLFTFIMRAVDWHREEIDGGYVWILGIALAVAFFLTVLIQATEADANQEKVLAIAYGVAYLICLIAIFVPHYQSSGSSYDGGSGYSSSDDGCPGGGCY